MKIFIKLADSNGTYKYLILPIGKIYDSRYGELDFKKERIQKIVDNFKNGIPAYPPPINIEHNDYQGKYGEIKAAEFENGLLITVELNEEGKKLIQDKKFEYMSVELEDYLDHKTGESAGEVLVGAALTNRPANPYVPKIELSEKEIEKIQVGGKTKMTAEEIEAMKKENERLKEEAKKKEAEAIKLSEENKKLADEKKKSDVEAKVKKWQDEGVPPAVAEKAKAILLGEADTTGKIKLSDGSSKDIVGLIDDLVAAVPKVDTKVYGKDKKIALSDADKVVKEVEDILEGGKK